MSDPDEREIDRAELDAYEVPEVPAGIEGRLWQRMRAAAPARSRRWRFVAGAVAVGAAASVAWFVTAGSPAVGRSGAANTAERTTLSIGRATLVAEPGTALLWTSDDRGVRVEQRSGNVFYRVEPGRRFVVSTEIGEISVLGTCFRVEVSSMKLPRQGLIGGAIGAAVTAGVFVAVFEGKVSLTNARGHVDIAAGQSASIASGGDANAGPPVMTPTNVVRLAPGAPPAGPIAPVASGTGAAATAPGAMIGHGDPVLGREVRDPDWATAQEQAIQARLQKNIGISPDQIELECRTRCCRVRLSRSLYDEHQRELESSVGLGGGNEETSMLYGDDDPAMVAEKVCFQRTDREPDRGAEREALLATIRTELASCARGLAHEVAISVELTLDESGAVTKAETRSDPTGEPVAACVERAVVGAAAFAPASGLTRLPVNVTLPLR
ncbi:MAG TPA: hypothetical protein VIX73_36810 [Kofleriaceae bacterium]